MSVHGVSTSQRRCRLPPFFVFLFPPMGSSNPCFPMALFQKSWFGFQLNLQTFSSMFTFNRNVEKKFWRLKWNPPTVWWNEKKKNVWLNHSSFRCKWRFQSTLLDQERGSNQNCYWNSADENQLVTEKTLHILFFSHGSCKMPYI